MNYDAGSGQYRSMFNRNAAGSESLSDPFIHTKMRGASEREKETRTAHKSEFSKGKNAQPVGRSLIVCYATAKLAHT